MSKNYDESSIRVLEGLEAVRVRPGMYIGSTNSQGLHHMIWEIVDNSIDEAMAGYASNVWVTIHKDGSISVEDNGRGIPIEKHHQTGKSTVETVLTVLHAGGKFDNDSYKVSGGLHGVGASVVNALSEWFKVWVWKSGKEYFLEFKDGGNPIGELKEVGTNPDKNNGTKISFFPDFTIMEPNPWEEDKIINRLKELAYLNKGIKISFKSEVTNKSFEWYFEGGLVEYVKDLNSEKEVLFEEVISGEKTENVPVVTQARVGTEKTTHSIKCEIAFQYTKEYNHSVHSFCNNINTVEGGVHEEGFLHAIVKIINKFAIDKKIIKDAENNKVTKEDAIEGLTAIISIKHPNPQYEGQTKKKLGNTEVRKFVASVTEEIFEKYMLENPVIAEQIVKKTFLAAEARKKSLKVREETRRKSPFESNSLPGKLADCSSKDASITELYIVEGDSAGGSAKTAREREFQAILPLRGKVINVQKSPDSKNLSNEEISYMIAAIGTGITGAFNKENLRYNKIIIMTDADVDGAHIRILLLTFFFRYMKDLILDGHVYIAQPPLYKFSVNKSVQYAYSDEQLEELKKSTNSKFNIQRYKGLGEMNPDQLWETTMNPVNRVLLQVTIEDAIAADKAFSLFMGDDVPPRKQYIEEHAEYVTDIDA